jgi:hypothetical protein
VWPGILILWKTGVGLFPRAKVELPTRKHGVTGEEAVDTVLRMDTEKLLDHANQVAGALDVADAAKWGKLEIWQPFLGDALNLALALDKLGSGKLQQALRTREAKARNATARVPQDVEHLKVQIIAAGPPKDVSKYAKLEAILLDMDEYEPVRVLDEHMGIVSQTQTLSVVRRQFLIGMSFESFDVKRYIFASGGPWPR